MRRRYAIPVIAAAAAACVVAPTADAHPGHGLSARFLGERIVPPAMDYQGTTVGGLSGIDLDRRTGQYVIMCDDRSDLQPARFYTASIPVNEHGVGPVTFTSTHPLLREDGTTYPPFSAGNGTIDPEDIRVDPWTGNYVWSQEGQRTVTLGKPPVIYQPSIQAVHRDGAAGRELPLPANERITTENRGPQDNFSLEGLTYAAGGTLLVSAVEGPLLQDAPNATTEHGTLSRMTVQTRGGAELAQYVYPQEPLFAAPRPPTAFSITGVSAMLAVDPYDPTKYLMMERSLAVGVGFKIRIFEIDTTDATNVKNFDTVAGKHFKPVSKRLVADLADYPLSTVDNMEGMTWGPRLPSGERTLILISDDNFAPGQVTQVIALAIRG
jgi:hypothetical protein